MIVCPLCEHQQAAGDDCEVCGRKLKGPGVVAIPVDTIEGLETTALADAGLAVAPDAVPELEPTHHGPVGKVAADVAPDLEPTRAAPVEVQVEVAPDLERTSAEPIPGDGPTPYASTLVCRYCRTPAPLGQALCDRCGMKLPASGFPAAPVAGGALVDADAATPDNPIRCPGCGTRNTVGVICSGCGSLLPRATE